MKFTHLELPPSSWSFDGPLPNLDEVEEAVEGADWRNSDSATARHSPVPRSSSCGSARRTSCAPSA
ncbi:MAG: hypothetical protein U1E17_12655 [Geminicoccaceae bacterium]